MKTFNNIRPGNTKIFIAALEFFAAEIICSEVIRLQVRTGGTVEDNNLVL
jgi:hypothetical protein